MSAEAKLDPTTLSTEERSLVDQWALKIGTQVDKMWSEAYAEALDRLSPAIVARRVFFSPPKPAHGLDSDGEPELKVCRNCGKLTSESHAKSSWCDGYWCTRPEPAQQEPDPVGCWTDCPVCNQHFYARPYPKPAQAVECPNCKREVPTFTYHKARNVAGGIQPDQWKSDGYTCQPAQPEPERGRGTGEFVEDGFGSCWEKCDRPDCGLQVVRPGKAQCAHDCHEPIRETQPAPAAPTGNAEEFPGGNFAAMRDDKWPAAPVAAKKIEPCLGCGKDWEVSEMKDVCPDCDKPAPAAPGEMPDAVSAIQAARKYAAELDHPSSDAFHFRVDGFVAGAKFARAHAQPVGITEELERVLAAAEAHAYFLNGIPERSSIERAIAAVRAQCEGRVTQRPKLVKVRSALETMRETAIEYQRNHAYAALAELNEWEGKP